MSTHTPTPLTIRDRNDGLVYVVHGAFLVAEFMKRPDAERYVALMNVLSGRDPSRLAALEGAIEHAASVFDELCIPAPAAHLRAALAAFRKRVPTSDTPKGPYFYWYQDDEAYFEYNSEILTLDEICALINSQHAEIERLRKAASRVLAAHRSHIDNTPHPNDKYENERRDSLLALRTALENPQ